MKQILLFRILGNTQRTVRRICTLMLGCKGLMDGRRGGLTVSALNYGSRGLGSRPDQVIALRSWAEYLFSPDPSPPKSINENWCLSEKSNQMLWWRRKGGEGIKCYGPASHPGGEKQHPKSLWPNKSIGWVMLSLSLTLTHQWAFWLGVVKRKSKRARILR